MPRTTLVEKWEQASLGQGKLDELLALGEFSEEVLWVNLLALACTALEDVSYHGYLKHYPTLLMWYPSANSHYPRPSKHFAKLSAVKSPGVQFALTLSYSPLSIDSWPKLMEKFHKSKLTLL